jgi:hypothetical protein
VLESRKINAPPSNKRRNTAAITYGLCRKGNPTCDYFACVGNYESVRLARFTSSASLAVYAYYHASKRHDDCPDDRRSDDGQLVCAAAHKALSLGSKIEHFRSYEVPDIPCCVTPQGT